MKKIILLFLILAGIQVSAQDKDSTWFRNNYTKQEV